MSVQLVEQGEQQLPPELAELAAVAAAADARGEGLDVPPAGPLVDQPTVAETGADVTAILQSVMMMAEPVAPYLPRAYTPDVCERIGIAVAAVAEKRGWDLGKLSSPELMLAFVTIPPTFAAIKMAKDYYAWREQQQARPEAANDPAENVVPFRARPAAPAPDNG